MQSIVLEIPENIAVQLKLPPKRAKQMLMEELVVRLYEQGIITAAQGSGLLNMNRFLASHQVAIHSDPEELAVDVKQLDHII